MNTNLSTRGEIEAKLVEILVEMFELEAENITSEANLYDDLDIDSIDAVDLIVRLKELTGEKVDPEDFKEIRTVDDVVSAIEGLLR
ncbi:MAG: acyl carrier protein [Gammaproteobacteria bacterium]|nr:acyl carrier protein [Gammaproteobacteria bacterium]